MADTLPNEDRILILQTQNAELRAGMKELTERLTLDADDWKILAGDHDGKVAIRPLYNILRKRFGECQVPWL